MKTIVIIAAAIIVNLVILYLIIKSATRSKQVVENQKHLLKVLIEMALVSGVAPDRLRDTINSFTTNKINDAKIDLANGKINQEQFDSIVSEYNL